jgi:hypothetical protein
MLFDPEAITIPQINAAYLALISLGLLPEIASEILNLAEYWCRQSYYRNVPLNMGSGSSLDLPQSSCLYLQTDPLGFGVLFSDLPRMKPQKVIFKIVSADSSDFFTREGPDYYNNGSWFDASIFREDESWVGKLRRDPMQMIPRVSPTWTYTDGEPIGRRKKARDDYAVVYSWKDPSILPAWLCREEPDKLVGGFKLVKNGERLMWQLQRNRLASDTLFKHKVEWTRESRDEDQEEKPVGIVDDYLSDENRIQNFSDLDLVQNMPEDVLDKMVDDYLDILAEQERTEAEDFNSDQISEDKAEEFGEEPPGKGAGSGNNFVASLQMGDRIGVWARAVVSISTTLPYSLTWSI